MRETELALRLSLFATLSLLLARLSSSAAPDADQTNRLQFAAQARHEEGPGIAPTERAYLAMGTNKYTFVVPAGFHLEVTGPTRVTLINAAYTCTLGFELITAAVSPELTPDEPRKLLLREHKGANILDVFSLSADSRTGSAFDSRWLDFSGMVKCARTAFIPSRSGLLEFSVVCDPGDFPLCQSCLATVMLTFRASDEKGSLKVPILSDKI